MSMFNCMQTPVERFVAFVEADTRNDFHLAAKRMTEMVELDGLPEVLLDDYLAQVRKRQDRATR